MPRKRVNRFILEHARKNLRGSKCRKPHSAKNHSGKIVMMKTELHKCDACGKTAKLESGKRHWCDCNPTAPFYMVSVRMRKMTDQLVGGFLAGIKRKAA